METHTTPKHGALSLFAGVGGIDLGLRAAGVPTVAFSELEAYPSAVMARHFPDAVALGDVTSADWSRAAGVRVIAGGFPCQDISLAGAGAGLDGERSGLWREYAAAIEALQPEGVLVENVAVLVSRGLDRVLADMHRMGYDAEWDTIPAAAVGAPHLRERLFIIAWPRGSARSGAWPVPELDPMWAREPDGVPRVMRDVPDRSKRLKCLGNAVVPQVAAYVAGVLAQRMDGGEPLPEGRAELFAVWAGEAWEPPALTLDGSHDAPDVFPPAGRMTGGEVWERERVAPRTWSKDRALEVLAPSLRQAALLPTPTASQYGSNRSLGEDAPVRPGLASLAKLLPTPTHADGVGGAGHGAAMQGGPSLRTVAGELIPTPTASLGTKAIRTTAGAVAEMARGKGGDTGAWVMARTEPLLTERERERESSLTLLPTPQASDDRDRGNLSHPSIQRRIALGKQVMLSMQMGGALHPKWVEWVMGFPMDWTATD